MALHCWQELRQLRHPWYETNQARARSTRTQNNANSTTETKHFIYFYLGHCAILLFKTQ
jgi:hypothetical protein